MNIITLGNDLAGAIEYRDVPGYPGYRASSDGQIWSCHINSGKGGIGSKWRKRRLYSDKDGYQTVILCGPLGRKTRRVAHVVLESFGFPRPPGTESMHFPDTDPKNNRIENLKWGTHQENIGHKIAMGTVAKGERHGMARLTADIVLEIRRLAETGMNSVQLGKRFGIHYTHAWEIVTRKVWRHLP